MVSPSARAEDGNKRKPSNGISDSEDLSIQFFLVAHSRSYLKPTALVAYPTKPVPGTSTMS